MKALPDACVDAVISDLPYGTTSCKWDAVIPFGPLWAALERVLAPKGVVVLTAGQPFTSALVMSNPRLFKYCLVWKKSKCGSPLLAKYRPMMKHEDVVVFGTSKSTYNPQMEVGKPYARSGVKVLTNNHGYGLKQVTTDNKGTRYPGSVLDFPQQWRRQDQIHPTQKPVELMRYLVRTYTNPGDVVLDMCCGSGTTLVAAKIEGRQFIGCDSEEKYVTIARKRLESELPWAAGVRSLAGDEQRGTNEGKAPNH
jgi:hypothetical protein